MQVAVGLVHFERFKFNLGFEGMVKCSTFAFHWGKIRGWVPTLNWSGFSRALHPLMDTLDDSANARSAAVNRIRVHQIKYPKIIGMTQLRSKSGQSSGDQVICRRENQYLVLARLRWCQ